MDVRPPEMSIPNEAGFEMPCGAGKQPAEAESRISVITVINLVRNCYINQSKGLYSWYDRSTFLVQSADPGRIFVHNPYLDLTQQSVHFTSSGLLVGYCQVWYLPVDATRPYNVTPEHDPGSRRRAMTHKLLCLRVRATGCLPDPSHDDSRHVAPIESSSVRRY